MRTVDEWRGKTDNTPPPARVKARILKQCVNQEGEPLCRSCTLPINEYRKPEFDHIIALCNGGENRESNYQAICRGCHRVKTHADVAMKSSEAKRLKKRLGLQPRRTIPGRRFDGTPIPARWR